MINLNDSLQISHIKARRQSISIVISIKVIDIFFQILNRIVFT